MVEGSLEQVVAAKFFETTGEMPRREAVEDLVALHGADVMKNKFGT